MSSFDLRMYQKNRLAVGRFLVYFRRKLNFCHLCDDTFYRDREAGSK